MPRPPACAPHRMLAARALATLAAGAALLGALLAAPANAAPAAPALAAGAPTVAGDGGIQVVDAPAPVYDFGKTITFHLTAEMSADNSASIASATLFVNTG